jgi:hypothetical protein
MERKFKLYDDIIICGTYTGKGDVQAYITNYTFSKMHRTYFYDAKDSNGNTYYAEERFFTKYRNTAEMIIESARKEYREEHTESEARAYESSFILGALKSEYNSLLKKHEKLLEKYEALEKKEVLNPIV